MKPQSSSFDVVDPKSFAPRPPTSFKFLTFTDVDRMRNASAKSRIRRHAMKDIGLSRRKPKKQQKRFVELELIPSPRPAIGGGGAHSFLRLPVEIDEVAKGLLANILRDTGECLQTAHRRDWFTIGLADVATFYQILANSEIHLEVLRRPHRLPRETPTSLYYHQLAVSAVRRQIEESDVTDGTIGAITGLLVYAELSGVYENWLPQRRGLVEVINFRNGGLDSIESNEHLRAATSWVELRGAYMQDIPAVFPPPRSWILYETNCEDLANEGSSNLAPEVRNTWLSRFPNETCILESVESISRLNRQVSYDLSKVYIPESAQAYILRWTNVVVHRLLSRRPLEDLDVNTKDSGVLEACRLGLLIFMSTTYWKYGAHPMHAGLHVFKLHQLLLGQTLDWSGLKLLQVWVLCISAMETSDAFLRNWFVSEIGSAASEMSGRNGTRLLDLIKNVLWIPELFDEKCGLLRLELEGLWARETIKVDEGDEHVSHASAR